MKKKWIAILLVIAVGILALLVPPFIRKGTLRRDITKRFASDTLTISDIAYDVRKDLGYHVLIKELTESGKYIDIPYLVLTDQYDGHTLLLREEPLDEQRIISPNTPEYHRTPLNAFLEDEFFYTLSPKTQERVAEVSIDVRGFLSEGDERTKKFKSKIFILSHYELGYKVTNLNDPLGEPLKYFRKKKHRILTKNGAPVTWYTRSQYHSSSTRAMFQVVWPKGELRVGGGAAMSHMFALLFVCPITPLYKRQMKKGFID